MKTDFPVYVLICEGPNPRRKSILAEIQRVFGRDPIIVEGVHKDAPDFETRVAPHNDYIPKGMVACATAHREIMRQIVDARHPFALVLEDDARLLGSAKDFALTFAELNYFTWDWVQFKAPFDIDWDKFTPYPDAIKFRHTQRAAHLPITAVCYGVSQTGAEKILKRLSPITQPNDHIIAECQAAHGYMGPILATCDFGAPSIILAAPETDPT